MVCFLCLTQMAPLRQISAFSCFRKMAHTGGNAKKEVSVSILLEFYFHRAFKAPLVECSKENAKVMNSTLVKIFVLS